MFDGMKSRRTRKNKKKKKIRAAKSGYSEFFPVIHNFLLLVCWVYSKLDRSIKKLPATVRYLIFEAPERLLYVIEQLIKVRPDLGLAVFYGILLKKKSRQSFTNVFRDW